MGFHCTGPGDCHKSVLQSHVLIIQYVEEFSKVGDAEGLKDRTLAQSAWNLLEKQPNPLWDKCTLLAENFFYVALLLVTMIK